mmetsp:Transcript_7040/g.16400  ORF Transcript_7040/g.16400 Transcript_7040/m.16400 type:complete len:241 (-) Transcript_7040:541-1263(-)
MIRIIGTSLCSLTRGLQPDHNALSLLECLLGDADSRFDLCRHEHLQPESLAHGPQVGLRARSGSEHQPNEISHENCCFVVESRKVGLERLLHFESGVLERERAAEVLASPLQFHGQHFHRARAALVHLTLEACGIRKRCAFSPQTETGGVEQLLRVRGSRGRDVQNARSRVKVLDFRHRVSGGSPCCFLAIDFDTLRFVTFVERKYTVEVRPAPICELFQALQQKSVGTEDDPTLESLDL